MVSPSEIQYLAICTVSVSIVVHAGQKIESNQNIHASREACEMHVHGCSLCFEDFVPPSNLL